MSGRGSPRPEYVVVVAMTRQRVIGCAGRLPWHLPEDLRLFRQMTTGHAVVMGRRTFESIGRPLPGRRNLVVSTTMPQRSDLEVCRSFDEALRRVADFSGRVFFIGGVGIFLRALPLADLLVISWVEQSAEGDVFFPPYDESRWESVQQEAKPGFCRVWYRRCSHL